MWPLLKPWENQGIDDCPVTTLQPVDYRLDRIIDGCPCANCRRFIVLQFGVGNRFTLALWIGNN